MRLRLTPAFAGSFLLLLLVLMELHEIVHISTGWLICGCWGPRDFNVWALCNACQHNQPMWWLATLAGPVFSFMLMWLGMSWLNSANPGKVALGFSLIFANIPFGRITTVMMGGGDEMVVVRYFMKTGFSRTEMILVGSVSVLVLGLPPMIKAYRSITNKRAWLYLIGFLTLPLLFLLLYTLIGLNTLLSSGFLSNVWILGTPLLITLHTLVAALLLIGFRKNLFTINAAIGRY